MTGSLWLFVFSLLIQRTSSPSPTALFTDCWKKILSVTQLRAVLQSSPAIWPAALPPSGQCLLASTSLHRLSQDSEKWDDAQVSEWNSSWWPRWGRGPRALGRHACLSGSRRRRPGGEAADTIGGVSSAKQRSPAVYLSIPSNRNRDIDVNKAINYMSSKSRPK